MKKEYDIFISYRREGGSEKAELLKNVFEKKGYSEERIFMDTHTLKSGDFKKRIKEAINNSANFVLVVTKDCWVQRDGEDYFFYEIKTAIEANKNIIPVLFDSIVDTNQVEFPEDVSLSITKNNSVFYIHAYADAFYDKLCSFLNNDNAIAEDYVVSNIKAYDEVDLDYDDALDALAINDIRYAIKCLIQSIDSAGNAQSIKVLNKVLWQNFGNTDWDEEDWCYFEKAAEKEYSFGNIALFFKYFANKQTFDKAYSYIKKALADKHNGYIYMCDGYARMRGIGVTVNLQSAYRRFEYANRLNVPESYSFLAETYLNGDSNHTVNIQKGINILKEGYKNGDSRSVFVLGKVYSSERYGLMDIEEAKRHFYIATELHYNQAWLELGKIHGKLFRVEDEYKKAIHCFEEAEMLGFYDGIAYKAQLMWKTDRYEDAVSEAKRGARLNVPSSISMLGSFYEIGIPDVDKWIVEHKPDFINAWKCYQTAFELSGDIDDAIAMARLFIKEDYRPHDYTWDIIEKYLKEAIQIPKIEAINLMIEALKKIGKPQDAHIYLKIGADTGSLDFKYRYATLMYTKDRGVATKYMREAAKQGNRDAIIKMVDWSKSDQLEHDYWMDVAYHNDIEVDVSEYSQLLCKNDRLPELYKYLKLNTQKGTTEGLFYAGCYFDKIAPFFDKQEQQAFINTFIKYFPQLVKYNCESEIVIFNIISHQEEGRLEFFKKLASHIPSIFFFIKVSSEIDKLSSIHENLLIAQQLIHKYKWRSFSQINYLENKIRVKFKDSVDIDFSANSHRITIIITDDVAVNGLYTKLLLKRLESNCKIKIVDNLNVVDEIKNNQSDLVILCLDLLMPKCSGFEIMKQLRDANHLRLRIIVVSAFEGNQEIMSAYNLGACEYICKPFGIDKFLSIIKKQAETLLLLNPNG